MSLKISYYDKNYVSIKCDNRISLWNILIFCCETSFLKQFVIENYEGGNTLVPKEAWQEENVTYKEINKNVYLFPYESIGFILNDNISYVDIYVIDRFSEDLNYKENFDLIIKIIDTDNLEIIINENYLYSTITLYLFSVLNIGFDVVLFKNLEQTIKSINKKIIEISYIDSSLLFTISGINFIIKVTYNDEKYDYYKIQCAKKCKKILLNSSEIKNWGFLKKKILSKNKFFPLIYYAILSIITLIFLLLFKRYIIQILILFLIGIFLKNFFKKNIYKIYNKFYK